MDTTNKQSRDAQALAVGVSVTQVIDLASVLVGCGLDRIDGAEELIDAVLGQEHASLKPLRDALLAWLDEDELLHADQGDACDAWVDSGEVGLALAVSTPVRRRGDATWGHCYVGWVYASTFDRAWSEALKWAQAHAAADAAREASHA